MSDDRIGKPGSDPQDYELLRVELERANAEQRQRIVRLEAEVERLRGERDEAREELQEEAQLREYAEQRIERAREALKRSAVGRDYTYPEDAALAALEGTAPEGPRIDSAVDFAEKGEPNAPEGTAPEDDWKFTTEPMRGELHIPSGGTAPERGESSPLRSQLLGEQTARVIMKEPIPDEVEGE